MSRLSPWLLLWFSLTGCAVDRQFGDDPGAAQLVHAVRAASPVQINGSLDEHVWRQARTYRLMQGRDRIQDRPDYTPQAGTVQFAWDEEHLYVAGQFEDDDLIAQGDRDNQPHFQLGDVIELFLKPVGQTHYWEMYATPRGKQTVLRLGAAGLVGLPGNRTEIEPTVRVAVTVDGTVNDDSDRDAGWTVELAIPIAKLTGDAGPRLRAGEDWQVLVARCNYGRYLAHRSAELTMYPQLSRSSFHDVWEYATLVLEP